MTTTAGVKERTRGRRQAAFAVVGATTAAALLLLVLGASGSAESVGPGPDPDLPTTTTVDDPDLDGTITSLLGPSTTTDTEPPPSSTTTTAPPPPSTTVPRRAPTTTTTAPRGAQPAPSKGPGGGQPGAVTSSPAPTQAAPAPPGGVDVAAPIDEVVGSTARVPTPALFPMPAGGRSTFRHFDLLDRLDLSPEQIYRLMTPFPVAGRATYSNDWGVPRFGPGPILRTHEGTDIFAAPGTPVIATRDGMTEHMTTTALLGGISLRVRASDDTYFYYAHLDRFASGLEEGDRVKRGEVVGFVGNTGNAVTTPAHLHFEIHPEGGGAVPPVPYLDRWLREALERIEARAGVSSDVDLRAIGLPMGLNELVGVGAVKRTGAAGESGPSPQWSWSQGGGSFLHQQPISAQRQSGNGSLAWLVIAAAGAVVWWRRRRGLAYLYELMR